MAPQRLLFSDCTAGDFPLESSRRLRLTTSGSTRQTAAQTEEPEDTYENDSNADAVLPAATGRIAWQGCQTRPLHSRRPVAFPAGDGLCGQHQFGCGLGTRVAADRPPHHHPADGE